MPERRGTTNQHEVNLKSLSWRILAHSALDLYFDPKPWERTGKIYEALGIRGFKRLIPDTGDLRSRKVKKETGKYLWINSREYGELFHHERQTRINESIHLTFLFGTYPLMEMGFAANPWLGAGISAINLVVNAYPLMLQRYNRSRLYRAMEKARK